MKNKYSICICGAVLSLTLLPTNTTVYGQTKITSTNDNYTFAKNNAYLLTQSDNREVQISETKDSLFKLLTISNQIYGDADIGLGDGQYPEDSAEIFQLVIQSATELYTTSEDNEEIATMITTLQNSMSTFLASKIDLSSSKAILLDLITETTELHNNAQIGKEIGNYPEEAKINLSNAINLAEGIYNTPKITQSALDNGINSLTISKEMFLKSAVEEVDLSKLIAKITEMELASQNIITGNRPGQTPKESKLTFDTILHEAQQLVGNCTYQESLDMVNNLDNAKKELDEALITYEKINRIELKNQIDIATDLKSNSTIGVNPGDYSQESFNLLSDALYKASTVYDDYNSSQLDMDTSVNEIKTFISDFKDSVIKQEEINTTELEELILEAVKLISDTTVGDEINQISEYEKNALQDKINSSKEILSSNPTKQSDISDAISVLKKAISSFNTAIKKTADKSSLKNELNKAIALQDSIKDNMIGDEVGKYPFAAKVKLNNATIAAQEAFLSDTITQAETNTATNNIIKAISEFENSINSNTLDKSELKKLIDKAEKLLAESVVGENDGMYPKEAYDKLSETVKHAVSIFESSDVTQTTLNTQVTDLESAISTFLSLENAEYKVAQEKLGLEILSCKSLQESSVVGEDVGNYPMSVMQAFVQAIFKAEKVLDSNSKVSSDYTKALEDLNKARKKFESGILDNSDLEKAYEKLDQKLKELSQLIKNADVSAEYGRVTESQKIALSIMYSEISDIRKNKDDLISLNEAIALCDDTFSDFNDGSLFVDENNKVQGRRLTGIVGENDTSRESVNILSQTEFIPQAGLPFNIKGIFASIGTAFLTLSAVMFKKKD